MFNVTRLYTSATWALWSSCASLEWQCNECDAHVALRRHLPAFTVPFKSVSHVTFSNLSFKTHLHLLCHHCVFKSYHLIWAEAASIDITTQWEEDWLLAFLVNQPLARDPSIQQPGFNLPRQSWTLLNCFQTDQGPVADCGSHRWFMSTNTTQWWPDETPWGWWRHSQQADNHGGNSTLQMISRRTNALSLTG